MSHSDQIMMRLKCVHSIFNIHVLKVKSLHYFGNVRMFFIISSLQYPVVKVSFIFISYNILVWISQGDSIKLFLCNKCIGKKQFSFFTSPFFLLTQDLAWVSFGHVRCHSITKTCASTSERKSIVWLKFDIEENSNNIIAMYLIRAYITRKSRAGD